MPPPTNLKTEPTAPGCVGSAMVESYATMSSTQIIKPGWSVPRMETMLKTRDGIDIHATLRGAGDVTVVVAHGFSGGHRHGSHSRLLGWFEQNFQVIAIDQRGHGKSGGTSTLSHLEALDVDAAVSWARELGAHKVVTVGFSMGSASVLRQAALSRSEVEIPEFDRQVVCEFQPDATVGIGGAAQWYFRGSRNMALLHLGLGNPIGRWYIEKYRGVRLGEDTWPGENHPQLRQVQPIDPADAARLISDKPLLIVQGTADDYFPVDHGDRLFAAASSRPEHRATYWLEQGMKHAENGTDVKLVHRVSDWIKQELTAS
jgi:pimeloyl-ACP methyl ester carboxylesterase